MPTCIDVSKDPKSCIGECQARAPAPEPAAPRRALHRAAPRRDRAARRHESLPAEQILMGSSLLSPSLHPFSMLLFRCSLFNGAPPQEFCDRDCFKEATGEDLSPYQQRREARQHRLDSMPGDRSL
jgi:hypothetical protein